MFVVFVSLLTFIISLLDLLSIKEAPPLMPALTRGRYHVRWTQLTDLPAPLHDAHVAVTP